MKTNFYKNISKDNVSESTDTLFLIEDNNLNSVYNSLSNDGPANNVVSIKTTKNPSKRIPSFFIDSELSKNKYSILSDIFEIKTKKSKYNKISFSENGYGNYMQKYSPETYNYLSDLLYHNFGYDNKTKKIEKRIPSYNDINKSTILDISYYNIIKLELIKNFKSVAITSNYTFEIGEIIKLKHKETSEQVVCKVTIPSYDISNIDNEDYYNLFEGYTKPNENGLKHQFHIEYIATIKGGIINFAEQSLNKMSNINKAEDKDEKEEKVIMETQPVENKPKLEEVEINKTENNINTNLSKEEKNDVINKPIYKNNSNNNTNWFGLEEDTKSILNDFSKSLSDDNNPSILDLHNTNYLVLSDDYLFELNFFNKKIKVNNKIKIIDHQLKNVFDTNYLFIKGDIYGEQKVNILRIDNIGYDIIDNFMKSKK